MASGAQGSNPTPMADSATPAVRRAPGDPRGMTPPVKRWRPQQPQNPMETSLAETIEDHAQRIDQHHSFFKTPTQTQVDKFQMIDQRDTDLRARLQQLETL